jgi:hypothetical protein
MLEEIPLDLSERDCAALTALRTALAAPQPEPFVVKHYTADLRPTIKGNGFDGLEIGISREEAEEFVAWVNARIAAPPAAAPRPEPGLMELAQQMKPLDADIAAILYANLDSLVHRG